MVLVVSTLYGAYSCRDRAELHRRLTPIVAGDSRGFAKRIREAEGSRGVHNANLGVNGGTHASNPARDELRRRSRAGKELFPPLFRAAGPPLPVGAWWPG